MTVETSYDADKRLVRQTYVGANGLAEYQAGTQQAADLFEKHGTAKCLIDLRGLDNKASLTQVYSLPLTYMDMKVPTHAKISILIDTGQKDEPIIRFYETVCLNRGWNAKILFSEDDAVEWLRE